MEHQELLFTNDVASAIKTVVSKINPSKLFVLTDVNTQALVLPRLKAESEIIAKASVITIKEGDLHKNLESLAYIWKELCDNGGTRHSMMINVGGGVVTDIGAFAGATFKRGIRFVNLPTTLLGAVDAAVGGKTGINFNGYKNEIGAFREADAVIISTVFLQTLPDTEILSGYAEMLKHGLISDKNSYAKLLAYKPSAANAESLLPLLQQSVQVKKRIVEEDPTEKGLRRALNLGHTVGHAFESFALQKQAPIPHGYAVAWGLVVELVLSHVKSGFPSSELTKLANYVHEYYGAFKISCEDYPRLLEFMHHDKKNANASEINFTLLKDVGQIQIDCIADEEEIKTALDIYCDLMHI